MTQVSRGNRPGVALPIRIHDLLLSLAGRLDDDALADARQMLASAELDRALEFVAGCLVAGGVSLTGGQHREMETLFADTYLDPAVIDRVAVREPGPKGRHRFAVGAVEGREPDRGVADAVRQVLDVLPDVRSVWCVWRLTPAGPSSGPVPHRVVLVGVGPGGFPPATAYRVEYALRRAGIRASVEVLVDGNQPTDYHQEAMRCARQVPFAEPDSGDGPRMSPVEPVRVAPTPLGGEQRYGDRPVEPSFGGAEPRNAPVVPPEPARPEPPRVDTPVDRMPTEPQRALQPPVDPPLPVEQQRTLPPPVELRPDAAERTVPPPVELRAAPDAAPDLPPPVPLRPEAAVPADRPAPPVEAPRAQAADQSPTPAPEPAGPRSAFTQEREPDQEPEDTPGEQPPSALSVETPTNSAPSPRRRANRPKNEPPSRPRLVPAAPDEHSAAFGDDVLNTQERNLLRELQDELARREKQDEGSTSTAWSGRHGRPGGRLGQARASGSGPMMINGVPPKPEGPGYPPAT